MSNPFPQDFLWGVATAGHQVEGSNVNSDTWLLEHLPGTIFAEPSGDAVDHYHRYREDIALIARLGFTSYRFSLEWARIEPEEGHFSAAELDHYKRVLEACVEHGLTPVVTFHHFTSPRWLLQLGGWEGDRTPELFARYCDRVMGHLGDLVGVACTLNEPNLPWLLESFGIGGEAPEDRGNVPMWAAAAQRLGVDASTVAPFQFCSTEAGFNVKLAAHKAATAAIKARRPDLQVGWTLANSDIQALPGGEETADRVRRDVNERFLLASRGDDFVGIQTYGRTVYGPENGLATEDDTERVAYLKAAVYGVASCLADGIDVRGYIAWTAFDNFEWIFGYRPRFGLIAVDRSTQERTPKESARWLGSLAREHARAWAPEPA